MIDVDEYVGMARSSEPNGTFCGECGLDNYHADDVGWFYGNNTKQQYVPLCSACFYDKFHYQTGER